ncbi:hypothetical protein CPB97_008822 [Podila verticillata]|nr:hypothetical protein CPB97_008822 [Podila verticillata]
MFLRLSYSVTKSFNKAYTITIAFLLVMCLSAIAIWTVMTKMDCTPHTSSTFDKSNCQPYNIFDGVEVRQSRDGITPFIYKDTIADLHKDYKYRNNNYTCFTTNYYRVVLRTDRTTTINYNVSCSFDDNVNFTLIASSGSTNHRLGWDSWFKAICPYNSTYLLEGFIWASDDNQGTGVSGFNLDDDKCGVSVWTDVTNRTRIISWMPGDNWKFDSWLFPLSQYSAYKREQAKNLGLHKNMKFVVGYTCSDCSTKSGWDLVLTLLTALGSLGGIVYTVLIFISQKMYERSSDKQKYDDLDLVKLTSDSTVRLREE